MHDAFPSENLPGRHQKDLAVYPERAMVDIPDIQKKSVLKVGEIPSVHLSPPSQTGRNEMATVLLRTIMRQIFHKEGPRSDKAHISLENIQELREFIQTGTPHQFSESRESIRVRQELPIGSAGIGHRAEFIQGKRLTVKPRASLREQEWPTVKDTCCHGRKADDGKKEREHADGHDQIEHALPWEEPRDRRFGRVGHRVHIGVNMCSAWRAIRSFEHRRIKPGSCCSCG